MKVDTTPISTLTMDPANVRKHSERNLESIRASLNRFGQQKPIVVNPDGVVLAGNGTLAAAKSLGWKEIQVVRTDLNGADAIAYAIADNRTAELAEWDTDALAETLAGLQNDEDFDHLVTGFTDAEIKALVDGAVGMSLDHDNDENQYTAKVEAPIYTPKGERPPVSDLTDRNKADALVSEIDAAKLPAEIQSFLVAAAQRHVVFNFRNIAEFYCHASPEVQDLMERSGLVIIDFKKAIQYGFVQLTKRLGTIADIEMSEDEDA